MDERSIPPSSERKAARVTTGNKLDITVEYQVLSVPENIYREHVINALTNAARMVGAKVTFVSTSTT